jgi:hypothetical protein
MTAANGPVSGPRVVVTARTGEVEVFPLSGAVMGVGRHQTNDISIADVELARFHARIERRGASFYAIDLGSPAGVRINDVKVAGEQALSDGDRITCAGVVLMVHGIGADAGVPGAADDAVIARSILALLGDPRVREIELLEGAPSRVVPRETGAIPGVISRRAVLAVLAAIGVSPGDERPLFDGTTAALGDWRVTARCARDTPAQARFRRHALLAIDDDIDPVPPG